MLSIILSATIAAEDMPGIIILTVLIAGLAAFFIVIARNERKKTKDNFSQYQKQFKILSINNGLDYNRDASNPGSLSVVNGSIGQIKVNYGLKYDRGKSIRAMLIFWRSDLDEFFSYSEAANGSWVHSQKSLTEKANLAFGIYLQSVIPFRLRLKKNAINKGFERNYTLAGESIETVARYLTPGIQQFIISRINPQEDFPFYLHVYYDEKGLAYGKIEKDWPLIRINVIDDFLEIVKYIMQG